MTDEKHASTLRSLLGWRGFASRLSSLSRRAGIVAITIACIALVATQLNYVSLGGVRIMLILAPIAACAMLYGTLTATAVGAAAGFVEFIYATLLPLDYYEKYFSAPINSILLFAFEGLLMGILFAASERLREREGRSHKIAVVLSCLVGSAFFTLLFRQGSLFVGDALKLGIPINLITQVSSGEGLVLQCLFDALFMMVLTFLSETMVSQVEQKQGMRTIRETFQGWLAVVVTVAYLLCAAFSYTGISMMCRADAETRLKEELVYLEGQLEERDKMLDAITRRSSVSYRAVEEVHRSSIESVASDFTVSNDSVSLVAEDGVIVSSNVKDYLDKNFSDVVGAGLRYGFSDDILDKTTPSEWAMGDDSLGYMIADQESFARAGRSGTYQVMVSMSSQDVFSFRSLMMAAVSVAFVVIFIAVYFQASILLQNVVVKGFDETNEALSHIIGGNLDEYVNVHDSVEFTHLSNGINTTVGVLKDSLAETRARINRELMTAKAIQSSALPQAFPPFPDIDRFDIYASMDPAREVGGDFYDFFLINDHTLGIVIADVSGKGVPAALFMMAAKTEIGNYMSSGMRLDQAIESANYHLCQANDAGMFVTVWAAELDWLTGKLTYVNAGHNPPMLFHGGSWAMLDHRGGVIVGSHELAKYRSSTVVLNEGDRLLLYTDGVTEAFSVDEVQYGENRLERYLYAHSTDHPHALVDGLRADVAKWATGTEQSDDITLLAIEYGVAPEVSDTITVKAEISELLRVQTLIHDELGKRLCPIAVQNQLDIALEELFVNICHYAYVDADEPGDIRVDYIYNTKPNSITIQLTDWGVPFDPLANDDPQVPTDLASAQVGGLGIFMARRVVDDISYLRDGDANVLAFRKLW